MQEEIRLAFIPHKDSLFTMAKIQQIFLRLGGPDVLPCYPLWAFCREDEFDSLKSAGACEIMKPDHDGGEYFFPVRIRCGSGTMVLRIVFARGPEEFSGGLSVFPADDLKDFPLRLKSFRTGEVRFKNNGWQLFRDTWVTCAAAKKLPASE